MFHARPVALNEAISPSRPDTANVDRVVPFGGLDLREETRLQDIADKCLAGRDDAQLFRVGNPRGAGRASHPYFGFHSGHILDPRSIVYLLTVRKKMLIVRAKHLLEI
jgi:hypothetical protein